MLHTMTTNELISYIQSPVGDHGHPDHDLEALNAALAELGSRTPDTVQELNIGGSPYRLTVTFAPTRWKLDRETITLTGPRGAQYQVVGTRDGTNTYMVTRPGSRSFLTLKIKGKPVALHRNSDGLFSV